MRYLLEDEHLLITEAYQAFKDSYDTDPILYEEIAQKYGPVAHNVYLAYSAVCWARETHHFDPENRPLRLDPIVVLCRYEQLKAQGRDPWITNPEFWNDAEMIISLCHALVERNGIEYFCRVLLNNTGGY